MSALTPFPGLRPATACTSVLRPRLVLAPRLLLLLLSLVATAAGLVPPPRELGRRSCNSITAMSARGRRRKGAEGAGDGAARKGGRARRAAQMQAPSRPAFSRSRGSFPDTRPAWTRFERSLPRPPIDVCAMEVVDTGWWASQGDGSSAGDGGDGDSFGAKAWPSSLAVARFLAEYLGEGRPLPGESESERPVPRQRQTVLELGCGTGIISQTVAAAGGAALATDVSPLALELTRLGWAETSKAAARSARKRDRNFVGEDVAPENGSGTLKLGRFDLMSERALPLPPPTSDSPPIVVASAVLYERSIAKAVSKRVLEAIEGWDAWVILGDDDTGMRDGGREVLQGELDAYEQRARASGEAVGHVLSRRLSHVTVQNSAFGWKEKPARMLHLNAPEDLIL